MVQEYTPICRDGCVAPHPRIYTPDEDSLRWCSRCERWFHECCLGAPPTLERDVQGVPITAQSNLAWSPSTQNDHHWALLIRASIARVPQVDQRTGCSNILSFERLLEPARKYFDTHGRAPQDTAAFIRSVLGGDPAPDPTTAYWVGQLYRDYLECPVCAERI